MGLKQHKDALYFEVQTSRATRLWSNTRTNNRAFVPYPTILDALDMLNDESEATYPEREALTRALIHEYQMHPTSIWSAVITLAYLPMLRRLRGRITSSQTTDDLDQLIVETFLEVVAAFSLDTSKTRTALLLRQATQREVFRLLHRDRMKQKRHETLAALVKEHSCANEIFLGPATVFELEDDEIEELISMLRERAQGIITEAKLALIIETRLRRNSLRDLIANAHPQAAGRDLATLYQRVKRERLRAENKLRDVLVDLFWSPAGNHYALPIQVTAGSCP